MGVLFEYFRAADTPAVTKLMEAGEGGSPVTDQAADGVAANGIEPTVTLGQLVAFVLDVPWDTSLVEIDSAWPPESAEDSDGPWVVALNDPVRDALAGVDDARLPELATRWSEIEELYGHTDAGVVLSVLVELVGLARRARATGDHLYCWMSL